MISVLAVLFAASYSIAMGNPQPRDVPVAVVAGQREAAQAQTVLERAAGTGYQVRIVASAQQGLQLIDEQQIYGMLSLPDPGGSDKPTLYISSASGSSVARLLEQDAQSIGSQLGVQLAIVDTHPLSPNDPTGVAMFYIVLAAVVIGFLGALQTRANAKGLPLGADLLWDAARSLLASLAVTIVLGPVLQVEPLPVLPAWALLATTMWTAGMTANSFSLLLGPRWGLLPTWLLFVIVANPSSGGAVAAPLLPGFYAFMNAWLPTAAAISLLRDILYFPGNLQTAPFVVLGAWLLASTVGYLLLRRRDAQRSRVRSSSS